MICFHKLLLYECNNSYKEKRSDFFALFKENWDRIYCKAKEGSDKKKVSVISSFNSENNYWRTITKETKTTQKLLLYCLWKGIVSSNCFSIGNQRSVAQKLDCHYNSICNTIKRLKARDIIQKNGEKNKKKYCLNFHSSYVTDFLMVISDKFLNKIETSVFRKIVLQRKVNHEFLYIMKFQIMNTPSLRNMLATC